MTFPSVHIFEDLSSIWLNFSEALVSPALNPRRISLFGKDSLTLTTPLPFYILYKKVYYETTLD
jgi:hypothetical protein